MNKYDNPEEGLERLFALIFVATLIVGMIAMFLR
jgi:hypothetical protein